VPGQQVDDPALAVDTERRFRRDDPPSLPGDPGRDALAQCRVPRVGNSIEFAG
jgi:hypothetical protein